MKMANGDPTYRVLIVGGGTGGHIYPALAIAESCLADPSSFTVECAGMDGGMEDRVIKNAGLTFHPLPATPLKGKRWWGKLNAMSVLTKALGKSWKLLGRVKPDLVVGTGGYVSGPLLLAAWLRRVPIVIHEQNSVPGLTNRIVGKMAHRVCTAFAEASRYFPEGRVVCTGIPVRRSLVQAFRNRSDLDNDKPLQLLVMGGSQGARYLNTVMQELAPLLASDHPDLQLVHQVGAGADCRQIEQVYKKAGLSAQVTAFIDDVGTVYRNSKLVVCRAGAGTLAELALAGLPAILIPYPFAADNHQEMNAREMVACGAALLLREQDASSDRLAGQLKSLLDNPQRLQRMKAAMMQLAHPDAADRVVEVCKSVLETKGELTDSRARFHV